MWIKYFRDLNLHKIILIKHSYVSHYSKNAWRKIKEKNRSFFKYRALLRKKTFNVLENVIFKNLQSIEININENIRNSKQILLNKYIFSISAVVFFSIITILLNSSLNTFETPFLFYYLAVILSGWYSGFKAGILATVLSTAVVYYLIFGPIILFDEGMKLGIFFVEGIMVSILNWLNHAQRKRLEIERRDLIRSEERFNRLLGSDIIGIIISEINGSILEANEAFLKMLGYAREDFKKDKLSWKKITPSKYRNLDRKAVSDIKRFGVCKPFEKEYYSKNGNRVPVILGGVALDAKKNKTITFVIDNTQQKILVQQLESKQKLAEDLLVELRKEKNMLNSIMENTDAQLAFLDTGFNFVRVNKAYEQGSGFSKESLIGQNHFSLFPNEENREIFKNVIKTGNKFSVKAKSFKFPNQPERGTTYWDWMLTPIKDKTGQIRSLVLSLTDVTNRIRAERNLLKINRELLIAGKIIETSQDLICVVDKNLIYRTANSTFLKFYDKQLSEVVGKRADQIVEKNSYKNYIKQNLEKAISGKAISFEAPLIYPKKRRRYMEVNLYPIIYKSQKFIVVVTHDITEKKIAEETQKSLNRKVTNILESINDAFFALDYNYKFTYINNRAIEFFGKKRDYLLGKNIWTEFPELKDWYEKYRQLTVQKKGFVFEELSPRSKKWLEVRVYPGKEGLSVYFEDITERKIIERQKDDFISIASHELKTPLTSIKAYNQILYKYLENKKNQKEFFYVQKMNNQIERLSTLVFNILDVSRLKSGKLNLNKEEFNMDELVENIISDFQETIKTHKIIKQGKTSRNIFADRYRIGQVVINLITNAVNYSPDKDKIVVRTQEKKTGIRVCVTDFGVGIPKESQNKIFKRFFRVENLDDQGIGGLGLGLYIASGIIKRHGGKIEVKSKLGKGSTFCFSIPYK